MRSILIPGCFALLVIVTMLVQAPPAAAAPANQGQPTSTASHLSGSLANIQKTGTLRVGVTTNAPWVMRDKNGQWIGLEIDLVRQLAQDMKWKIELVPTSWDKASDELREGHFDILASGLSITPQRALRLKFSHPYGDFALGLVVNRKSMGNDDLLVVQTTGKHKIGVLSETITAATAKAYLGDSTVVEVNDEHQAIDDLRDGKLDGYVGEEPLPTALAQTYPDQLRTMEVKTYGRTAHGFAVRRDDQDLLDVINAWLVYQEASGWIQSRNDFWIHSPDWVQLM